MKLRELVEKFLPNFQNRLDEWNKQFDMPAYTSISFCFQHFPEALQNFADKICDAQRDNCCEAFENSRYEWNDFDNDDMQESYYQITKAEQPKIEEL